jgi:DNA-binding response OmpR family regulator
MNLLVVEDDARVASSLRKGLQEAGYSVQVARRVVEARKLLGEGSFDLVLLDLGLPDGDGLELLRDVRSRGQRLPVVVLTARDEINDRVRGLDGGADDYLVKPYAFSELLARLRALLRRSRETDGPVIAVGDLSIDLVHRSVRRGDQALELTPREFDMLAYLSHAAGQIVSRETLAREVWKVQSRATPMDNVIDVHMTHLRDKIDKGFPNRLLHTVRGVGFVLKAGS